MAVVGRNRITFTGLAAVVRLGYQKAAVLGAWRVEDGWLTARVEEFDGFRITQTPLMLEIQNQDASIVRRPLAEVTVSQGQLSARLLPKESREG